MCTVVIFYGFYKMPKLLSKQVNLIIIRNDPSFAKFVKKYSPGICVVVHMCRLYIRMNKAFRQYTHILFNIYKILLNAIKWKLCWVHVMLNLKLISLLSLYLTLCFHIMLQIYIINSTFCRIWFQQQCFKLNLTIIVQWIRMGQLTL